METTDFAGPSERHGNRDSHAPCGICGDTEPSHVHHQGKRIEGYFTVGRGETDFQAAQRWKLEAHKSAQRALDAERRGESAGAQAAILWKAVFGPGGLHHLLLSPGGMDFPEIQREACKIIERARAALADQPENPDLRRTSNRA